MSAAVLGSTDCLTGTATYAAITTYTKSKGTVSFGWFPDLRRKYLSKLLG